MSQKAMKKQNLLEEVFKNYDSDGNSFLSAEEFPCALNKLKEILGCRVNLTYEDSMDLFHSLDINCDDRVSMK